MAEPFFKSADLGTEESAESRIGQTLQYEREKQGLTVGSVAQRLCLSKSLIERLEAGDTAALPETVYVRGYIRAYCSLLGMDSAPLLDEFAPKPTRREEDDFLPAINEHIHRMTRLWGTFTVLAVVILLVSFWWMERPGVPEAALDLPSEPAAQQAPETFVPSAVENSSFPNPASESPPAASAEPEPREPPAARVEPEPRESPAASAEPEPRESPAASAEPESRESPAASAEPEPRESPAASAEPESRESPAASAEPEPREPPAVRAEPEPREAPAASAEPEPRELPVVPPVAPPVADDEAEISIQTSLRSWARLSDGTGAVLVERMLPPGYSTTVHGEFPLDFRFGDARGMRVWVNGLEYDVKRHINRLNVAFFTLEEPLQ